VQSLIKLPTAFFTELEQKLFNLYGNLKIPNSQSNYEKEKANKLIANLTVPIEIRKLENNFLSILKGSYYYFRIICQVKLSFKNLVT